MTSGEGPLVVLVPGMGDLRRAYRFLAPGLREAGYPRRLHRGPEKLSALMDFGLGPRSRAAYCSRLSTVPWCGCAVLTPESGEQALSIAVANRGVIFGVQAVVGVQGGGEGC